MSCGHLPSRLHSLTVLVAALSAACCLQVQASWAEKALLLQHGIIRIASAPLSDPVAATTGFVDVTGDQQTQPAADMRSSAALDLMLRLLQLWVAAEKAELAEAWAGEMCRAVQHASHTAKVPGGASCSGILSSVLGKGAEQSCTAEHDHHHGADVIGKPSCPGSLLPSAAHALVGVLGPLLSHPAFLSKAMAPCKAHWLPTLVLHALRRGAAEEMSAMWVPGSMWPALQPKALHLTGRRLLQELSVRLRRL